MQIRHEELLTSRLEEAALNGCAFIRWEEMYLWYGVQKIAAGTWRDLASRWDKVVASVKALKLPAPWSDPGKLHRVDGRGGMYIFGDGWMKPV
jgi:hypothetical protein